MSVFPETRWTLIGEAARGNPREALGSLFQLYWGPMCACVTRTFRFPPEEAEELVQDFVTHILVSGSLLERVDHGVGRFRAYLAQALKHFVVARIRGRQTQRRHLDLLAVTRPPQADADRQDADTPAHWLDTAWALSILAETLGSMKAECEAGSAILRWELFERRMLRPLLAGEEPVPYRRFAERLDYRRATNALATAKRQFQRHLHSVLHMYATRRFDLDAVVHQLTERAVSGYTDEADRNDLDGPLADLAARVEAELPHGKRRDRKLVTMAVKDAVAREIGQWIAEDVRSLTDLLKHVVAGDAEKTQRALRLLDDLKGAACQRHEVEALPARDSSTPVPPSAATARLLKGIAILDTYFRTRLQLDPARPEVPHRQHMETAADRPEAGPAIGADRGLADLMRSEGQDTPPGDGPAAASPPEIPPSGQESR